MTDCLKKLPVSFLVSACACAFSVAEPIDISDRLELFVDDYLIESTGNVTHQLQHPVPRETALTFDKPWEGRYCGYVTVIDDGDGYRLYYRGLPTAGSDGSNLEGA